MPLYIHLAEYLWTWGGDIMPLTGDKIKFGAHAETFQTFMIIEFYLLLFWLSFNCGSSLEDIKQSWT